MPVRAALIASLVLLALMAGCGTYSGEEPDTAGTDKGGIEALLQARAALAERHEALLQRKAELLANYGDFENLSRRGRVKRALEALAREEAGLHARLQRRGLFPNDLRYAVPPPSLLVTVESEPAADNAAQPADDATDGKTAEAPATEEGTAPSAPAAPADQPPGQTTTAPDGLSAETTQQTDPSAAPAPGVRGITLAPRDGALAVHIATTTPRPRFKTFTMSDPPRIVVDTPAATAPTPPSLRLAPDAARASAVRMGWHPEWSSVRVVIDCAGSVPRHSVTATAEGITILLAP